MCSWNILDRGENNSGSCLLHASLRATVIGESGFGDVDADVGVVADAGLLPTPTPAFLLVLM